MSCKEDFIKYMKQLPGHFVHGKKILRKIQEDKFRKENPIRELIEHYCNWHQRNEELKGYDARIIKQRVQLFNEYKNFIDTHITASAQSKFHSSALEEFLYYLFRDYVREKDPDGIISLGGTKAYTNLYFSPMSFQDFIRHPRMRINSKDQDFSIFRVVNIKADTEENRINVPVVSIECKTYIDKTMLEGSIATAEKIKNGNPYSLFIVVTEYYDVSFDVDPKYSRIDQIFVLRKQKRPKDKKSRKNINSIDEEVVIRLFEFVREHLERPWSDVKKKLEEEGTII